MDAKRPKRPILVAGPTASGKSALAMALAERLGGVVVNADSMQVYRQLRVLTARPSPADEARVPHRLYGHVDAADPYSVARWLADVAAMLSALSRSGERAIVVGGTGLYFKALTDGLAEVPPIPDDVRRHWRAEAARVDAARLHDELRRLDPVMARRLAPSDRQRVTRALEVVAGTGRSLASWQHETARPALVDPQAAVRLVVMRPRADLEARADGRFRAMLDEGATEEVRRLIALGLPDSAPLMRAIGVRPLAGLLAGRLSREAAIEAGQRETRQYIKRQLTWLKRHMIAWNEVHWAQNNEIDAVNVLNIDD